MSRTSVAQLHDDNAAKLQLSWVCGREGAVAELQRDNDAAALIGHLNLIHPNRIQVIGSLEAAHLDSSGAAALERMVEEIFARDPAALILADGAVMIRPLLAASERRGIAVLATPLPAAEVIEALRRYLAKTLADTATRHGVFMDVLGLGVLITGNSGIGKSELGLELISRGHGLVADDVVEIYKIAAQTLEGRCPAMLKDFLEVRGLGMLNIRTIFGETAVRPKMKMKLIVHLDRPNQPGAAETERLPLHELSEEILGITVRKVVIPVVAGRNLAVLLEAAVRNYVLQLRGLDSTAEFIARQHQALNGGVN
jgi:HPr kinase/phosphorylase